MINRYEKHKDYVNAKTYKQETNCYWFTHKNVRKTFIHIMRALPDMFHYLENSHIPNHEWLGIFFLSFKTKYINT